MILDMVNKQKIVDAYPKATWITPSIACQQPHQILTHVVSLMSLLAPLKDVHQLNPRYLKDIQ
jgi:hypothetical protein